MAAPAGRHAVDEALLQPYRYLSRLPGKSVRNKMIEAFQEWLAIAPAQKEAIQEIVTELHNASLLVDDIEDNSRRRRGQPAAHAIYGVPTVINTANYVYFIALERVQRLGSPEALAVFVSELLRLHRGQGQDIAWRDSGHCPTEEEYQAMVLDKTGGLFRLAVGLMQAFSADKRDYSPLLNDMAAYFQIRDDYVNLALPAYQQTKSFCEDITEGKFSFPIIHAIRTDPEDTRLSSILRQRTEDLDLKRHAVECMREKGSFAHTRATLRSLRDSIMTHLRSYGGHAGLARLIEALDAQLDVTDAQGGAAAEAGGEGAAAPDAL